MSVFNGSINVRSNVVSNMDVPLIYSGSRRLLTYRRKNESQVNEDQLLLYSAARLILENGTRAGDRMTADDLNGFRRKVCTYNIVHQVRLSLQLLVFQGFKNSTPRQPGLPAT